MGLIETAESYRRVHDLLRQRDVQLGQGGAGARAGGWPPQYQGHDLGGMLRARRSVREFSRGQVDRERLSRIVAAALETCENAWPAARHGALPLTVIAAVRDEPGLAWVRQGGCDPMPVLNARLAGTLSRDYADAPAILFLCGDPHQLGPSGYGSVLVRVGAAGYAIWLAAIADGLQGSVYGRSSNEITRVARQVNPRLRHLFTVAIGRQREDANAHHAP